MSKDSAFRDLEDLRGKTFAFTDPDSNTGRLVPLYWLSLLGETPESFFGKTLYTYSHDNSILAVSRGLVDGAAVDSLIWEFYAERNPEFVAQTGSILKSEPFGIPPVVASSHLDRQTRERIRNILLSMHENPEGKRILSELAIDRFLPSDDAWYASIRELENRMAPAAASERRADPKP